MKRRLRCFVSVLATAACLPLAGCIPPVPSVSQAPVKRLTWSRVVLLDDGGLLPDRERTRLRDFFQRGANASGDSLVTIIPTFGFRPAAIAIEADSGRPSDINEQASYEPYVFGRRWVGVYAISIIPADGQQPLTLKSSQLAMHSGRESTRKATFEVLMRELESRFAGRH
jgi:hypothetical protein